MNAVLCKKGSNVITHVVHNCVQSKGVLSGDNINISGVNPNKFDIYWTNDTINRLGNGYDKTLDQLTLEANGVILSHVTYEDIKNSVIIRRLITDMTFQELETYINANVNSLADAKVFLIRLAKVVLALSKILDAK